MPSGNYPEPKSFITAEQRTLGDVFLEHERRFIVPLNQRPWAWNSASNIQDLLNDFENILTQYFDPDSSPKWKKRPSVKRAPHFFGTFVFYEKTKKDYEIFDGQQRITAICMLCAILREVANELQSVSGGHRQKASDLYGGFNDWLALSPTTKKYRLVPNRFFEDLFNALIFEAVDEGSRQSRLVGLPTYVRGHTTTKRLTRSFYHIRNWVHEKTGALSAAEQTAFLSASYDVLRYLFACVESVITDEKYAYEVFGRLNATGVKLDAADKIKNELFIESDKTVHDEISSNWQTIGEKVPRQDIGEFLRRRYIAFVGPCKTADIYERVRDDEIKTREPKTLVKRWLEDSGLVQQIIDRSPALAKTETIDRLEVIFDVLNVGLAYIPLLVAAREFLPGKKDEFHQCVALVERYVFRQLTIAKIDTTELEQRLGDAARMLAQGKSLKEFRAFLRSHTPDTIFENEFGRHVERRSKVQYYILRELEIYLMAGGKGVKPGDHHSAKNHIEHILPRKPSQAKGREDEWKWARAHSDKHKMLVNRLGNLLILESDIEKAVGSHVFAVKKHGKAKQTSGKVKQIKCYEESALRWPKNLCDDGKWPDWTEKEIEERQKQMASDAVKVWKV